MPKYKTIIEVETEAADQLEAMDIAGEYLRGNLDSGVVMKCRIQNVNGYKTVGYTFVSILLMIALATGIYGFYTTHATPLCKETASSVTLALSGSSSDAMQPALVANSSDKAAFREKWEKQQNKVLLEKLPPIK